MKSIIDKIICLIILCTTLGSSPVWAQFRPDNPEEPSMKYKVEVTMDPENIGYTQGNGFYRDNETLWIYSWSWNSSYIFSHWTLNGERYDAESNFYYQINQKDAKFVAHYVYAPENPSEPSATFRRRLTLKSEPENLAYFYLPDNGRIEVGQECWVSTGWPTGYRFLGWYDGDKKVSDDNNFYYQMPDRNVTLTARFKFSPDSPNEPGYVPQKGDVNNDGKVSVADLVSFNNYYWRGIKYRFDSTLADMNNDGVIDYQDWEAIKSLILGL